MKKFALLAAGLISLGLGIMCACTNDNTTPPDPDPNPNPGPVTPDDPVTEQVGDFGAIPWVSKDGVLDLSAGTFSGAQSFELTKVEGQYADTVIYCTADGVEYTLSLNEDGALDMKDGDGGVVRTFMMDITTFAGAWYDESDTSAYYVISSNLNEDGYFTWKAYSTSGVTPGDPYRAVSVFLFNSDNSAGMFLQVLDEEGKAYLSYSYSGSSVYMGTAAGSSTAVVPFNGMFESVYLTEDLEQISISFGSEVITTPTASTSYTTSFGMLGSGLYYNLNNVDYALVYMNDGVYILGSDGSVTECGAYDNKWLTNDGEWSSGTNMYDITFKTDGDGNEVATFNNNDYVLQKSVSDGVVKYSFDDDNRTYTITPVRGSNDVFEFECGLTRYDGYWLRDTLKETFVQTYTSNAETFVIDENYNVKITPAGQSEPTTDTLGEFVFLPSLGSVAITYEQFGAGGASPYFAMVNSEGVYWALVGDGDGFAVYSTYFTLDYAEKAKEQFTAAFDENYQNGDYFTTGGTDPKTFAFDFDTGLVTVDGGESYYFSWGYGYIRSTEMPELYVEVRLTHESAATADTYGRYTLFPSEEGLSATYSEIVDGVMDGDEVQSEYIAQSIFAELCNIKFVYDGAYVPSELYFAADGSLNFTSFDTDTSTESLTKLEKSEYTLSLSISGGKKVFTVNCADGRVITIVDMLYATMGDTTYSVSSLAEVVGDYFYNDSTITLYSNATLRFDGKLVNVTNVAVDGDIITVKFSNGGVSYTAEFKNGGLTLNGSSAYEKIDTSPEKFIGHYTVAIVEDDKNSDGEEAKKTEITVIVGITAANVNQHGELYAIINNVAGTPSLAIVDGKQQLTFSVIDMVTFKRISCTMVLDDSDVITITVSMSGVTGQATYKAAEYSYSDFVFEGEKSVGSHTFKCVVKGGAPLYLLDGVLCDSYQISSDENGKIMLTVSCEGVKVVITPGSDGVNVALA